MYSHDNIILKKTFCNESANLQYFIVKRNTELL